jgi:hypothetical protein
LQALLINHIGASEWTKAAGSGGQSLRQTKAPALIERIVFDIDICKGLSETVPATGSRRKSRDHLRPRSGRTPQPCGIGSSSTRLRLGFLRRTRVHHHKRGWARFRATLPLQERRYQMSVSQGFSSRRFPSANDSSPAIWWCTRARSRASATASWATRRRTATTSSGRDHHVINRRMSMGDAMMNWPLIARLEMVLRHRQRNIRKQRCQKRDNLQGGHLHTLLTPKLTQTRR